MVKIFNMKQADVFVKHDCKVVEVGLGERCKVYIGFQDDENFKVLMKRWKAKEF